MSRKLIMGGGQKEVASAANFFTMPQNFDEKSKQTAINKFGVLNEIVNKSFVTDDIREAINRAFKAVGINDLKLDFSDTKQAELFVEKKLNPNRPKKKLSTPPPNYPPSPPNYPPPPPPPPQSIASMPPSSASLPPPIMDINERIKQIIPQEEYNKDEGYKIRDTGENFTDETDPNEIMSAANNYIEVAGKIGTHPKYKENKDVKYEVSEINSAAAAFNEKLGGRSSELTQANTIIQTAKLRGGKRKSKKKKGTKKKKHKRK